MRRAVILGSNGPPVFKPPLKYALNDVYNLQNTLSGPRCGFDVTVPGSGSRPSDVIQLIRSVANDCGPEDTFICHFSGHGLIQKGELFLIWDKTDPSKL